MVSTLVATFRSTFRTTVTVSTSQAPQNAKSRNPATAAVLAVAALGGGWASMDFAVEGTMEDKELGTSNDIYIYIHIYTYCIYIYEYAYIYIPYSFGSQLKLQLESWSYN